jgi:NitT/TauT family transport system substrate-binding protein
MALLAAVFGAVPRAAMAQPLTPVSIRMDVFFYGAHVPILLGIVDGIYKKYGLDVTAQTGRGSATTIQTVANQTDQFGFADGGTLVRFAAQGLRAKQVVGMLQENPMNLYVMPDSPIKTLKDLNGRTGGFTAGSAPEQLFPALAKKAGIDLNSIKRVSVDIPTRDNLFIQKQTEFSFGYSVTQLPLLQERCNCKLTVFRYAEYGLTAVSNGIIVSDKYAAENPAIVGKFAKATAEAIDAAVKNPKRAVDAFFEYAKTTQLSRAVITNQWQEATRLLHTQANANQPAGVMDAGDWQKTIDLLVEYADVPKGAVTPQMVFTNEFLK